MMELMHRIHEVAAIPYAWEGEHAGWQDRAKSQGLTCSAGTPSSSPNDYGGDTVQCRCFLEYLYATNRTADGLWICHDTAGMKYNRMLAQAMPHAEWFTTIRHNWQHLLATYKMFQAPLRRGDKPEMQADACQYDGLYGDFSPYTDRLGLHCFVDLMVDPTLRHCHDDEGVTLTSSQLCALGSEARPTARHVRSRFTVLPAEAPVTSLLSAMLLRFNVSKETVQAIHANFESECKNGGLLGFDAANAPRAKVTLADLGYGEHDLDEAQAAYTNYSVEVRALHALALDEAATRAGQYKAALGLPADAGFCWDDILSKVEGGNEEGDVAAMLKKGGADHHASERWTTFDNSNLLFSNVRLDQCLPGLPQNLTVASSVLSGAPANSSDAANGLLRFWLQRVRAKSETCFNTTGYPTDLSAPQYGKGDIVADRFKLSFRTVAKVASMTAAKWMQCRFGGSIGPPAKPEYTRLQFVRAPSNRAVSSFTQIVMHYLVLLRLPPDKARACADAWPSGLDNLANDATIKSGGGSWPAFCRDAWTTDAYEPTQKLSNLPQLILPELRATADSRLLKALWELPSECRTIYEPGRAGDTSALHHNWFCEGDGCDGAANCSLSDQTRASLLGHALSDAANADMIGCGSQLFGGEHMWPQHLHASAAGRADAILRLESLSDDEGRLESEVLAKTLGAGALPPASDECSIANIHENLGTTIEPMLGDEDALRGIVARSTDLQRRICAFYYHDFVCGGYALPEACQAPAAEWLDDAVGRLLSDAEVEALDR